MDWLSSLFKTRYRNIREAEEAAFRAFYIGFLTGGIGLALRLLMAAKHVGVIVMAVGGAIVLGSIIRFIVISNRATAKACPRCGTSNPVFEEETHFKCTFCGHVVILRDI